MEMDPCRASLILTVNRILDFCEQRKKERRLVNTIEDMFNEGDNFCSEGERLETKGEMALSLAFYTNAASKFKQITLLNSLSSDVMLRAQIRRESCLKKARTMYRRLLVQSAQKSSQNTEHNNLRSSRKTNQVRTERRPCNSCSKSCFWLKDGLCSDCDLRASELHRRTARRNVASRLNGPRDVASRVTAPRDFTRPRVPDTHTYTRTRRTYDTSESNDSSEEEFAPVKSCAICHTHRQQQPSYHSSSYRRRCC